MGTQNLIVVASLDDTVEIGGTLFATAADCYLSSGRYGGFRFQLSAAIPSGSTITSCVWTPYVNSGGQDDPDLDIYFEDSATPANYSSSLVSARSLTTASVSWSDTAIGDDQYQDSPDLATPFQELLDSVGGFSLGDWVNVVVEALASADFRLRQYDGSSEGETEPKLSITWTEPGGGGKLVGGKLVGGGILRGRLVR